MQGSADQQGTADAGRRRREQSEAWDRIGQMLESLGSVSGAVVQRNLDLWNDISTRMQREDYDTEEVVADTARMMTVAMDNAVQLWSAFTRPVPRERNAVDLPTAFLFFDRPEPGQEHTLLDPVLIPLPRAETEGLPERAEIVLGGLRSADDGVDALTAILRARLDPARGYWIETHRPAQDVSLVPGAYDGFVYVNRPPRPLGTLRIVVEGPPPSVVP